MKKTIINALLIVMIILSVFVANEVRAKSKKVNYKKLYLIEKKKNEKLGNELESVYLDKVQLEKLVDHNCDEDWWIKEIESLK